MAGLISISSPAVNLHSPGAIGDVTPGTVGATEAVLQSGGTPLTIKNGANTTVLTVNNSGTVISGGLGSILSGPTHIFFGDFGNGQGIELKTQVGSISLWSANGIIPIGDVSASYPALKRSGTKLIFRLGDDSADTAAQFSRVTISNIPTSSSGLSSGDVYSNAGILTIVP